MYFDLSAAGQKWGCPLGWLSYRGSCYKYYVSSNGHMNWYKVRDYCRSKLQAHMITISDYNENAFVQGKIPMGMMIYILRCLYLYSGARASVLVSVCPLNVHDG